MQTQRINITLPKDLAREFRRAIPDRSRSKFIAEALKQKLQRKSTLKKELIRSLKANKKFDEAVMKDWAVTEVEGWSE